MTVRSRRVRRRTVVAGLVAVAALVAVSAVAVDAFEVREKLSNLERKIELFVDPPPDRAIAAAVRVTPEPDEGEYVDEESAEPTVAPSLEAGETAPPAPTRDATAAEGQGRRQPAQEAGQVVHHPARQGVVRGRRDADRPRAARQGQPERVVPEGDRVPDRRVGEPARQPERRAGDPRRWSTRSRRTASTATRCARTTRAALALRDAAKAISKYHAPVILLSWRGAHTWVMTGYRADADPLVFKSAKVSGAYILDPWYPRVSSIWGASDPPGGYQDAAEMRRNYLAWKRPEGHYPDRDGLFIAVVPTQALDR